MAPPPPSSAQTARVVWLALISSVLIYAVVGWVLGRGGALPLAQDAPAFLTPGFALASLALAGTSFVARRVLLPAPSLGAPGGAPLPGLLVGWALCEAIAVLGFVHHLLFAQPLVSGALMAGALALLVVQAPPGRPAGLGSR